MNICIFGASSNTLAPVYYEAAEDLGRRIARGGHTLVFGGGERGLMGACADGAAAEGGESIGVAPRFFDEPGVLRQDCTRFVFTGTMAERKSAMEELAEAFIVLPGGIGTFEEFFEVLTLKALGRHDKPMTLLNTAGCYDSLLAMLKSSAKEGFTGEGVLDLFAVCRTPEEALAYVLRAPQGDSAARNVLNYAR